MSLQYGWDTKNPIPFVPMPGKSIFDTSHFGTCGIDWIWTSWVKKDGE